jgi:hypothetical protein
MWGVVLGDNGVGKTTFLRSIAMGLCDAASAAGLLREIYGDWNRRPNGQPIPAEIHLEFFPDKPQGDAPWITTHIEPSSSGYSQIRQVTHFSGRKSNDFPWDRIFACGYGAGRRAFGSKDIEDYATIDAVYTLFNYSTVLQNPELVLRRLAQSRHHLRRILNSIAQVLMLPRDAINLSVKGLTISGPWGNFHPIGALGDGYQATLAWLTDLLGWALLYDPEAPLKEVTGIVLIDELEQHLHPRWQKRIIGLLRQYLPNVQFIATTHTPMCAIGTTELSDAECELVILKRDGPDVYLVQDVPPPRRLWADQILTSSLFGLSTAGDEAVLQDIKRYAKLNSAVRLTPTQKRELTKLRSQLSRELAGSESDLTENVAESLTAHFRQERDAAIVRNPDTLARLKEIRKAYRR